MRFGPIFPALLLVVASCLAVLTAQPGRALAAARGPLSLEGTDWEGCSELVRLARDDLGPRRVVPTGTVDFGSLRPEDAIVILHPERVLDVASLARFMRAGGRVVLLDDFGTGSDLLEHFGLRRVAIPKHPAEMLRHNPSLALAEPSSVHPVVSDVTRVVTNHASGLSHPDLSPVLEVRSADGDPPVQVAVAGAVGRGRLLAVGDPSIVMNSMLVYPGNRAFARGLLRYASDDDAWGHRDGRVLIVSGAFDQRGVYGEEEGPLTDLTERLRSFEDGLAMVRREGLPPWASFATAVALGLGIVVWVGSNAGRTHRPAVPRFTRPIPLAAQGGVAGHAAVLAADGASRALAMLELKASLEEQLTLLLGLDEVHPPADVLVTRAAADRLLDDEGLHLLKRVLLRMAHVETLVLSRRGSALRKVRDDEVIVTARQIRSIVEQARQRRGRTA